MLGNLVQSFFKRPVTQRYPFERQPTPKRLRGKLHYDASKCTACRLCERDCPSNAIEIIVIDKANKQFAMKYDVGRCTFCGQCEQSCRFNAIDLSSEDWELASCTREPFKVYYGPKPKV
jgi:formate hydrogenlyase subunit 6/NADH:ubiquinone oxidoreductase subunit I